mgnify:CR=1 FL=1
MKLPHGLSSVWMAIPAGIFILVLGWFVFRLPVFKSASIISPEGKGIFSPSPIPSPLPKYPLNELDKQISEFVVEDQSLIMPVFDKNILLPLE